MRSVGGGGGQMWGIKQDAKGLSLAPGIYNTGCGLRYILGGDTIDHSIPVIKMSPRARRQITGLIIPVYISEKAPCLLHNMIME